MEKLNCKLEMKNESHSIQSQWPVYSSEQYWKTKEISPLGVRGSGRLKNRTAFVILCENLSASLC